MSESIYLVWYFYLLFSQFCLNWLGHFYFSIFLRAYIRILESSNHLWKKRIYYFFFFCQLTLLDNTISIIFNDLLSEWGLFVYPIFQNYFMQKVEPILAWNVHFLISCLLKNFVRWKTCDNQSFYVIHCTSPVTIWFKMSYILFWA